MTSSSTDAPPCPSCGGQVSAERRAAWNKWASRFGMADLLPDCDACADAAWRAEQAQRAGAVAPAEGHEARVRARLEASGLPRPAWDLRIGDLHDDLPPPLIDALHAWAREGGGLFLHGPVGTGKTTLAHAATRAAIERRGVTFTSVPALVMRHRAAYGSDAQAEATRTLTGTGALVLDDLGQEPSSEDVRNLLFAAIDPRVSAQAPLLITSNLTPSALGERYGAWLPSRIQGYCAPWRVLGRDRRLDHHTTARET